MATRAESYALKNLRQIMLERLIFLSESCRTQESGAALIQIGLSQKEYGKLFGASRQSVNKELNLLQQQNLIKLQKNGIFIYDVEKLLVITQKNS
jgi:CRP-like cAMP-binding protein